MPNTSTSTRLLEPTVFSSCAASDLTWPPPVDACTTSAQSRGSAPEKDPLWISTGRSHLSLLWWESLWETASRPAATDTHCRQRPVTHISPPSPLLLSPSSRAAQRSVYTSSPLPLRAWRNFTSGRFLDGTCSKTFN